MKFKLDGMRAVLGGLAALLLASCGGGTQIESFVPSRVISFGDEASLINTDGSKYTVNAVAFDTTVSPSVPKSPKELVCTSNQVWTQQVASSFGLGFEGRCPDSGTTVFDGMYAEEGGTAADLNAQIDLFIQDKGGFTNTDLVTVMAGVNDIIDAAASAPDPVAAVEAAGTQVGDAVVRITNLGAKVLVSTVPDVGFTPYAISREETTAGTVAMFSNLTTRFNTRLRLRLQDVRDGGRAVGLVLADDLVLTLTRYPSTYDLTNLTQAACAVQPITACDMTTLVTAAQATYGSDWLWADDRHLGANAQNRLGSQAVNRARTNPF